MSVVIWTLARTGGTALTAVLRQLLGRVPTYHEPLNPNEVWGSITRSMTDADASAVSAEISRNLTGRPIVKHCVELVPFRITEGLVNACMSLGYRHLMLFRRDETARMLSWLFMAATKAASRADLEALSEREIESRLSMLTKAHFVTGARNSRASLGRLARTKTLLEKCGAAHFVVAYEDVFLEIRKGIDNPAFVDMLRYLAIDPEIAVSENNAPVLRRWLIEEHQQTARYHPKMMQHFRKTPTFASALEFEVGEYAAEA